MKHKNRGLYTSPLLYASVLLAFGSGCSKITQHRTTHSSSSSSIYSQEENIDQVAAQDVAEADNQADAVVIATRGKIQVQGNKANNLAKVALVALTAAAMPAETEALSLTPVAEKALSLAYSLCSEFFDSLLAVAESAKAGMEVAEAMLTAVSYLPILCVAGASVGGGIVIATLGATAAEKGGGKGWIPPIAAGVTGGIAITATAVATSVGMVPGVVAVSVGMGSIGVVGYKTIRAGNLVNNEQLDPPHGGLSNKPNQEASV